MEHSKSPRSASGSYRNELNSNPEEPLLVEAQLEPTSIGNKSPESDSPILLGQSHLDVDTAFPFCISPREGHSGTRQTSNYRSHSPSEQVALIPQDQVHSSGQRMLSSDEDIGQILKERISQKSEMGRKMLGWDISGKKRAWCDEQFSRSCKMKTIETSPLAKDWQSQTISRMAPPRLHPSDTSESHKRSSPTSKTCLGSREVSLGPQQTKANSKSQPPDEGCLRLAVHDDVIPNDSRTPSETSLPHKEVCPQMKQTKSSTHNGWKQKGGIPVSDLLQIACSACIDSPCIFLRDTAGNPNGKHCINCGLECAITIPPAHDGNFLCPNTDQGKARRAKGQEESPSTRENTEVPTLVSHTEPSDPDHDDVLSIATELSDSDYDDVLSIATEPPELEPDKNSHPEHEPHETPTTSQINVAEVPHSTSPTTSFQASLKSQEGYSWVKDWSQVQPERLHPERRHGAQRRPPKIGHKSQVTNGPAGKSSYPQSQRDALRPGHLINPQYPPFFSPFNPAFTGAH